tara:strand:+ start:2052 stop:2498 length:447 start_codon:yes stop_codon:yes gene_type:complete
MQDFKQQAAVFNKMLTASRSAVETYQLAIKKYGDDPKARTLDQILNDHRLAIAGLEVKIGALGSAPAPDSGTWGKLAYTIQSSSSVLGSQTILSNLQNGEELELANYQAILDDETTPSPCREMVEKQLLPQAQKHIATLKHLQFGESE